MNRRNALMVMAGGSLAAWAGVGHAADIPPQGAYTLSYDDQAIAVDLVANGEARAFTVELEEVPSPLTVTLNFDGMGGFTGTTPFSGGAWKWSGTASAGRIIGKTTFTYGGASATSDFDLVPRKKMTIPMGQGGRKAKAPRGRRA